MCQLGGERAWWRGRASRGRAGRSGAEGERARTMRRPVPARVALARDEARHGDVGQAGHLAVAQRHVDVLAPPRARPRQQRREHRVARVQARRQVRDRYAYFDRRAVALARDVHESEFAAAALSRQRTAVVGGAPERERKGRGKGERAVKGEGGEQDGKLRTLRP